MSSRRTASTAAHRAGAVADAYPGRLAKRADNLPVGDPFTAQVALGPQARGFPF